MVSLHQPTMCEERDQIVKRKDFGKASVLAAGKHCIDG